MNDQQSRDPHEDAYRPMSAVPEPGMPGPYGEPGMPGPYGMPPGSPKHSGLGIASFVLALVGAAVLIVATIGLFSAVMSHIDLDSLNTSDPAVMQEQLEAQLSDVGSAFGIVLAYPFAMLLLFVGLILGIIGLARKGTRKVFAVLGTVLCGLQLLIPVLFILISLAAAFAA